MEREKLLPLVGMSDITIFYRNEPTTTLQRVRVIDVGENNIFYVNPDEGAPRGIQYLPLSDIHEVRWKEVVDHKITGKVERLGS